ncbi:hypothetical protein [Staphylococcus phage VB-SauS-SA2]|nr:hypothetical protein [Staphylococcus phage VB-SauS-SA2]
MEQRIKTALVIKVVGQGYLSETGRIVDFNHAGIINSPVIAKGIARKFNAQTLYSIGMKYDVEIELIELEYKTTGTYITGDLEDD